MIKLKPLLKEGVHGKYWWMNPQGKLTQVLKASADTGHREIAMQLLKNMNKVPDADVFNQMYNLGWLRLGFKGEGGYYTLEFTSNRQPNARQLDALKDLATELNAAEIRNSATKQTYSFGLW